MRDYSLLGNTVSWKPSFSVSLKERYRNGFQVINVVSLFMFFAIVTKGKYTRFYKKINHCNAVHVRDS